MGLVQQTTRVKRLVGVYIVFTTWCHTAKNLGCAKRKAVRGYHASIPHRRQFLIKLLACIAGHVFGNLCSRPNATSQPQISRTVTTGRESGSCSHHLTYAWSDTRYARLCSSTRRIGNGRSTHGRVCSLPGKTRRSMIEIKGRAEGMFSTICGRLRF